MNDNAEFIAKNLGLVHSCCSKFKGKGIEYDDLFQAGCVGLLKAAKGFDESRGLMFSTYAVPVILGELKRMFRDGGSVKVGRTLKELSLKAVRTSERLSKTLGREPTVSEIAQELETDADSITEALCAAQPTLSLSYEGDDGLTEYDIAVDGSHDSMLDKISLAEVMEALPENDKKLIILRYYRSKTQTETAAVLGMSQVQVSRKEKAILLKLRGMLA